VELKLQIEQLRARVNEMGVAQQQVEVGGQLPGGVSGLPGRRVLAGNMLENSQFVESQAAVGAIEPPGRGPVPVTLTISPGMTMAEIEKAAITAALAETRGNRRKAAELLGIGERTMYRKLRDYGIPAR
jgi:DNA-binding NtrC family response regulator